MRVGDHTITRAATTSSTTSLESVRRRVPPIKHSVVSRETIRRRLANAGIRNRRPLRHLPLTPLHRPWMANNWRAIDGMRHNILGTPLIYGPRKNHKKTDLKNVKPTTSLRKTLKKTSLKIAREEDSLYESTTPVSKRSRRRKTFKTSDVRDTDTDPSDTDYVIDDVKDIIRQYHPVCVALQETFLKSSHTTKIRRYGCVRKDTEGSSVSGGVCIFKKAKANARRVRRQSQRKSWIRYVSSLTSSTSSKQLWRKVKAANECIVAAVAEWYRYRTVACFVTGSSPVPLKTRRVGQRCTLNLSRAETSSRWCVVGSVSSTASYNSRFLEIKRRAERTPMNFSTRSFFPYSCDFTIIVTSLKKGTLTSAQYNSGLDRITYAMLRHLNPDSLTNILYLFNRVWKEHYYPSSWKEAIMIPILKPGKVATDPLSYRPIALTSCFCKTFERMVNTRLVFVLEKEKLISSLQSGFRKGRSTLEITVFILRIPNMGCLR
ncbi:probable RNA-directed DNA polymerase from transposon X-element [Trichonephila clavipes]|nr:probable RNA-directed DNA polymerase from transposon X-element [Trichonephila clavipes]